METLVKATEVMLTQRQAWNDYLRSPKSFLFFECSEATMWLEIPIPSPESRTKAGIAI